jgi:hypothetical protein
MIKTYRPAPLWPFTFKRAALISAIGAAVGIPFTGGLSLILFPLAVLLSSCIIVFFKKTIYRGRFGKSIAFDDVTGQIQWEGKEFPIGTLKMIEYKVVARYGIKVNMKLEDNGQVQEIKLFSLDGVAIVNDFVSVLQKQGKTLNKTEKKYPPQVIYRVQ